MAIWDKVGPSVTAFDSFVQRQPGYGSVVYDDETRVQVRLYWKGAVPDGVRRRLVALPSPVETRILTAGYTNDELVAAADRLVRRGSDPEVVSAGPRTDASGLTAEVTGDAKRAVRALGLSGTADGFSADSVPVTIASTPSRPRPASRQLDTTPFWGGDQLRNTSTQDNCGSGFRMRTSVGGYRMTTAFHCTYLKNNGQKFNTFSADHANVGTLYGTASNGIKSVDVTFLTAPSGSNYGSYIWTGPYNGLANDRVAGSEAVGVGDYVCMSGDLSGVVCGNKVVSTGQSITLQLYDGGPTYTVKNAFITLQTDGVAAAGQGDSGSPAFVSYTTSAVKVVGSITGIYLGKYAATCGGAYWVLGQCSSRVIVSSAKEIEKESGYTVG